MLMIDTTFLLDPYWFDLMEVYSPIVEFSLACRGLPIFTGFKAGSRVFQSVLESSALYLQSTADQMPKLLAGHGARVAEEVESLLEIKNEILALTPQLWEVDVLVGMGEGMSEFGWQKRGQTFGRIRWISKWVTWKKAVRMREFQVAGSSDHIMKYEDSLQTKWKLWMRHVDNIILWTP